MKSHFWIECQEQQIEVIQHLNGVKKIEMRLLCGSIEAVSAVLYKRKDCLLLVFYLDCLVLLSDISLREL